MTFYVVIPVAKDYIATPLAEDCFMIPLFYYVPKVEWVLPNVSILFVNFPKCFQHRIVGGLQKEQRAFGV